MEDQHAPRAPARAARATRRSRRWQSIISTSVCSKRRRRPTSRPSPTRPPASRSTRPTAAAAGPCTAARARRRRSSRRSTRWPAPRPRPTNRRRSRTRTPATSTTSRPATTAPARRRCCAPRPPAGTARPGSARRTAPRRSVRRRRRRRQHRHRHQPRQPDRHGRHGQASLQISASDSGGAALTYSATGLPTGLSINATSGLISGTPTAAGTYSVTVTAKDTTGASGSASFTWTISRQRRRLVQRAEADQPGLRVGLRRGWTASQRRDQHRRRSTRTPARGYAWLDGYGIDPHRHAGAVGHHPGRLHGDADVLPVHRQRGRHVDAPTTSWRVTANGTTRRSRTPTSTRAPATCSAASRCRRTRGRRWR